jgi:putative ABC transport system permease protein
LKDEISGISQAVGMNVEMGGYNFNSESGKAAFVASGEHIEEILPLKVLYGRMPSAEDVRENRRVAVIDDRLAAAAYGRINVIGKTIQLKTGGRSENFTVIGVSKPKSGPSIQTSADEKFIVS